MAAVLEEARKRDNGAIVGFEQKLWGMADTLRGGVDAAEYKHVVLGLVFLKYISDAFEAVRATLAEDEHAEPDDPDEYLAENVFWVPEEARWAHLQANARQPTIGRLIDDAMLAIEKENESLKGVLPKDYAREALDKTKLGDLIDTISTIDVGDNEARAKDVFGRVYEYFLAMFASAEGRRGGEFYTPRSVVQLLVEMLEPFKGRVFDPCCGSGGMFVQSERFVEAHGGRIGDIAIYGQEMNHTTWRLAKMNMAVRGIDADIRWNPEGSFIKNEFRDERFDYILANPPFNVSSWWHKSLAEDVRWHDFGTPPQGNANYAWLLHIIHHLKPTGTAGVVLANGSMSSTQSGEGDIRKRLIEADLVDCMIALPSQLFYSTQIPACLWFIARDKKNTRFRDRRGEVLFIDARKMGHMVDRVRRELSAHGDGDIARVTRIYHAWRGEKDGGDYEDVGGFCKSATLEEIRKHGHVLTPGRYVGAAAAEDNGTPFEQRFETLKAELEEQFVEADRFTSAIRARLAEVGDHE
jgi:type I restriction enzyme M protein